MSRETRHLERAMGARMPPLSPLMRPRENGRCPLWFEGNAFALHEGSREKNVQRAISWVVQWAKA